MPTHSFPSQRVLTEEQSTTVCGVSVDVYVYAEEYSPNILMAFVGHVIGKDFSYEARHVRAEIPAEDGAWGADILKSNDESATRLFHDRQYGGSWTRGELPEEKKQIAKVLEKVESHVKGRENLKRRV